ncbi:hypothetical protein FHX49_000519 [Microbacterium endophyticum]|uniref:Lipoprotein n=1 Tax=Microbacterium endophyticum TaxID=1526412 RepID=A0A7W4YLB2_9MICO|nr:hypothetical protein [Microbacterium endophyticum]MBB2974978.1 hypothetical protein [Microbacterium endophyticum]NIK37275.1 hypothetical protein [Microbacterium endophyticum]
MARRSPLVARAASACAAACLVALVLTSCGNVWTAEGSSKRSATRGIAIGTDNAVIVFSDVVFALPPGGVAATDHLDPIAENILLTSEEQATAVDLRRAPTIYGFTSTPSAAVIDVFIPSAASTNAGLYAESTSLYGCAQLRADQDGRVVTIKDLKCPDWLVARNPDDATEVSLSEAVSQELEKDEWVEGS